MPKQITPVTPQLAAALNQSYTLLRDLSNSKAKLNDHDWYLKIVDPLEMLTIATLSATSSAPLTKAVSPSARFDIGAGTTVARVLTECVSYLRNDATGLLSASNFSKYEAKHVDVALNLLKGFYGLLTDAIVQEARADLSALEIGSPNGLLEVAAELADQKEAWTKHK